VTPVNIFERISDFLSFLTVSEQKLKIEGKSSVSLERNAEEESRGKLCEVFCFLNRIEENRYLNFTLNYTKSIFGYFL
jgi:hypothetical protein